MPRPLPSESGSAHPVEPEAAALTTPINITRPPLDVVVIGASLGGVSALQDLVRELPEDLPAAILIVLHIAPTGAHLADILDRAGSLRTAWAKDGERIHRGRIYVAPPDRHLIVRADHVHLTRTPKENWTRPAINVLFRSAATAFGNRVAGVLLTGTLDDGTAGLLAIEAAGGVTLIQDPEDAAFPEMPRSALDYIDPNYLMPLAELPAILVQLIRSPDADGRRRAGQPVVAVAEPSDTTERLGQSAGECLDDDPWTNHASGFTCPECTGPLWEVEEYGFSEYICRIGHRFSPGNLLALERHRSDEQLQSALSALCEETKLAERLLERGRKRGVSPQQLERLAWRMQGLEQRSNDLNRLIEGDGFINNQLYDP
jgi:two-component system, chemotaxis family, protein-glutamate methylesterase/glutaminase